MSTYQILDRLKTDVKNSIWNSIEDIQSQMENCEDADQIEELDQALEKLFFELKKLRIQELREIENSPELKSTIKEIRLITAEINDEADSIESAALALEKASKIVAKVENAVSKIYKLVA